MVIHPSYYDACDVSCDVIYYAIAVRARRMVRIFFLPYLGNPLKSDPRSYELFCLESHTGLFLSPSGISDSCGTVAGMVTPKGSM